MYSQIPIPRGRISKNAINVWRISSSISHLCWLIVFSVLLYLERIFTWKGWIGWLIIGLIGLTIISAIWSIAIKPSLLYKNWRFGANEDFLQLKSGAFKEEHQLVPMTKIQSVSTKHGPLLRKYKLYSISVETLGSSHQIPALPVDVAIELRNQIAHFAKIKEVDE